jgi:hypothetical protein
MQIRWLLSFAALKDLVTHFLKNGDRSPFFPWEEV